MASLKRDVSMFHPRCSTLLLNLDFNSFIKFTLLLNLDGRCATWESAALAVLKVVVGGTATVVMLD